MRANNLWEQNALSKLTTVEQVDAVIQRCNIGRLCAPSEPKRAEWTRKLTFLDRLKQSLLTPAATKP